MDDAGVYEWEEVEDFVAKYFAKVDAQQLSPIIDIAANRFNVELELEDEEKADFKIKAKQFENIRADGFYYAFMKYLIGKSYSGS